MNNDRQEAPACVYDCRLLLVHRKLIGIAPPTTNSGEPINVIIVSGDPNDRPIWLVEYDRWRDEQWSGDGYPRPIRPEAIIDPKSPVRGRFTEQDFRNLVHQWDAPQLMPWLIDRVITHGLAVLIGKVSA